MTQVFKNIVVLVSMDEKCRKELSELQNLDLLLNADNVYFANVFNKRSNKFLPFSVDTSDVSEVEEYILSKLHNLSDEVFQKRRCSGKIHHHCMFNGDEKLKTLNYLKEVNANLVVAPTRGEQGVKGLFKDSFCFWLVEHAPCDVLVIRPKD